MKKRYLVLMVSILVFYLAVEKGILQLRQKTRIRQKKRTLQKKYIGKKKKIWGFRKPV